MKYLLPFLFCLAACYPEVEYQITESEVVCKDYDEKYTFLYDDYTLINCVWYCHNYRGSVGSYVSIDFRSTADGWYLDSSFVEDGVCY